MGYFLHIPVIETQRLRLRRLMMRDAADVYAYSRDPLVAEHVLWDAHKSIMETRGYIRYMLKKYRAGEPASWGIAKLDDDKVIGTIGFMWIQPENAAAEVGYSLARAEWNKGYMTEALNALIAHGLNDMGLNRIEAMHETSNPASGAVMLKCGMKREGLLRSRLINKGKFVDVELYAITKGDVTEK
ncbi:MAG: GNAT family N-acetyltransferase [Christensenellales bacterium]